MRKNSRERPEEQARIAQALSMIPKGYSSVLDVGARDGYISKLLVSSIEEVTALDLELPSIDDHRVMTVKGDVTCLEFPDSYFDVVVCLEVLEHIPQPLLHKACDQIARVARYNVLIGVPYNQDIRVGRTTCFTCGKQNPPWGHVNSFNEKRLVSLFPQLHLERFEFTGETKSRTNLLSVALMDLAGNPYGVYDQDEVCIFCCAQLKRPAERKFHQKVFTRLASVIRQSQERFASPRSNWVHCLLSKP